MISVSPNEDDILKVLRGFLLSIEPSFEVFQAQGNRVPEPKGTEFIVMTPIQRPRLGTNLDEYIDAVFVGSIAGTTLTITEVLRGSLKVGSPVFGVGIADGTEIVQLISGAGGLGTYKLNKSQTISSETLAAGTANIRQKTDVIVQLDIHAADLSEAGDTMQKISTLYRDSYATSFFVAKNPKITPLYMSDPRQAPFQNAEQQYETRWTADAHIQADQSVVGISQQFAAQLKASIINVDAEYPPQ